MLNFSEITLDKIIIHNIGNKNAEEGIQLSKNEIEIHDLVTQDLLISYFTKPFKSDEFYRFDTQSDGLSEIVHNAVQAIFGDNDLFFVESANIAKRLYEVSTHPNIKRGELYIVYFKNCVVDDELTDAIGIFKSETKDTYIKVYQQNESFDVNYETGININKLDKGCLIFNTEAEVGYKISIVDSTNKNNEAVYWKDSFLEVKVRENNFYKTTNFLNMCRSFSESALTEDNDVETPEKINFLNDTVDYFKNNSTFDEKAFEQEVFKRPETRKAFEQYKQEYEEVYDVKTDALFDISDNALKTAKKHFKSVIKLDKNFHIYVHAKPDLMEKGYDEERNMNYYKLFYTEESD